MKTIGAMLLLLILWPGTARPAKNLTLEQCIALGVQNNVRLRNAALNRDSALQTEKGAGAIYDTQLSAAYTHSDSAISEPGAFLSGDSKLHQASAELTKVLPSGTKLGLAASTTSYEIDFPDVGELGNAFDVNPYSTKVEFSVSQPLLRDSFGESTRSIVQLARFGSGVADQLYQQEDDKLRLSITEAYWNLHAARASRAVGDKSLTLAIRLNKANTKKYEDNLVDETDKLATEVLVETRGAQLIHLQTIARNAQDNLARIIRIPQQQWNSVAFDYEEVIALPARDKPLTDAGILYATAIDGRKDLAALRLRLKQAETEADRKQDDLDPDLSVFASVARGADEDDFGSTLGVGDSSWSVGVMFKTPLTRTREKSEARKATLAMMTAENDVAGLTDVINQECRSAARALVSTRERLESNGKTVKLLEKKLDLETVKYNQGRSDIRWAIQTQEELAQAKLLYHVSYAEYQKARATCLAVQGIALKGGAK